MKNNGTAHMAAARHKPDNAEHRLHARRNATLSRRELRRIVAEMLG